METEWDNTASVSTIKRAIRADTALRLSRFFGMSERFWLNLQQAVDLWNVLHSDQAAELEDIEPVHIR